MSNFNFLGVWLWLGFGGPGWRLSLENASHLNESLPLCFREVIISRLAVWSMLSCLCCAEEWSLPLNTALPKQNAGSWEYVFSPLKSWMGKIWLRLASPVLWNICIAPRNLFFRWTPTQVKIGSGAIYRSAVYKSKRSRKLFKCPSRGDQLHRLIKWNTM